MKRFLIFIVMLLSITQIRAIEIEEIQVTADYSKCLNYVDDQLTGVSATIFWEIPQPFLIGVGAGTYYGYSEEVSLDIYASAKYRLREYHSLHPFLQMDLGSAAVFTFRDYSVMANPKFGFEFPYYDGKFVGAVGLRYDYMVDSGISGVCIGISLGYVF